MTKLGEIYQETRAALASAEAGSETPDLDARLIILHHTKLDHADFITGKEHVLADDIVAAIRTDTARRRLGEPVSRILGVKEFWGLEFEVTPDTLDP